MRYQQYACAMHGKPCLQKKIPKEYAETTIPNDKGFPSYRSRRGERTLVLGVWMDNRSIVPYNPYLLLKYNAHINFEVCTLLSAIKYIYKYIFKAFDCANVAITSDGNQLLKVN